LVLSVLLMVGLAGPATLMAELPAFPGAEGEGMYTSGGRGGEIYHVTNLNDAGAGSLRYGFDTATGTSRTIVFDVGGTIALNSTVWTLQPNVSIAGQTAPGQGITLINYGLVVGGDNTVVRHLRVRPGDARKGPAPGYNGDSIFVGTAQKAMIDHCSTSWSIDELLSCASNSGFKDLTVQYCIISEALDQTGLIHGTWDASNNPGGTNHHAMGSLIKPINGNGTASYHHNLWSQNFKRIPAIGAYNTSQNIKGDIRNNVLYNNLNNGYNSGDFSRMDINWVGNYAVAGSETSSTWLTKHFSSSDADVHFYISGNKSDGDRDHVHDGTDIGWSLIGGTYTQSATPWPSRPITTETADAAYNNVLAHAGAFWWARDSVDTRLIKNVFDETGSIIDSQSEVGGYPTIPTVFRPAGFDTDDDGMPNYWETWYGTNSSAADNNGIGAYGYTHVERYLQWLLAPTTVYHFGDINGDNAVNVGDLGILAGYWGQGGCDYDQGDFTNDGVVNVGDLGVLAGQWGWTSSGPVPPSVPEPTCLALLALGGLVLRRR
jgi:hypothetical protein